MYRDYRIVIVVPAGRKRYLELQLPHILKCRDIVDEYRYWVNTTIAEDIAYMEQQAQAYPEFITLDREDVRGILNQNICKFFKRAVEPDTIYLRLDDDIIWMDADAIRKLLDFRIDNPKYFMVLGNIVNNSICDHIHQRLGVYDQHVEFIQYDCLGNGWSSANLAKLKHDLLVHNINKNNTEQYKFSRWELSLFERFSIGCISWFGSEFAQFKGEVGRDEEQWLTVVKPREINKPNCVCGTALFSHFAFYTQRDVMDKTYTLDSYKRLT